MARKKKKRKVNKNKKRKLSQARKRNARKKRRNNKRKKVNKTFSETFNENYKDLDYSQNKSMDYSDSTPLTWFDFLRELYGSTDYEETEDFSSFISPEEQYILDMKKYAFEEPEYINKYPVFDESNPTYQEMDKNQLNFYLLWRKKARSGDIYLVDYAYYRLYFTELINLIGGLSPEEALNRLNTLFFIIIDERNNFELTDWGCTQLVNSILDFTFYFNLNINKLDSKIWLYNKSYERVLLALESMDQYNFFDLPFILINQISQFELPKKSKFYMDQPKLYQEALRNVFYLIDQLSRKEKKKSFVDNFKYVQSLNLYISKFEGIVTDPEIIKSNYRFESKINSYLAQQYFCEVIQKCENVFRELYNYKSRLRKYPIDEWTGNIIEDFLKTKYGPDSNYKYTDSLKPAQDYLKKLEKSRNINLNLKKLEQLRSDTEKVQNILDTTDYNQSISLENNLEFVEPLTFTLANLAKTNPDVINVLFSIYENSLNQNEVNITDFEEKISQTSRRYLNFPLILNKDEKYQINNLYLASFRNIVENREKYSFLNIKDENSINEEVNDFLNSLNETQVKFLEILMNESEPLLALNTLAESELTMVEILIDEINNNALLYLDDILLEINENDLPEITEEYSSNLKNLLRKEI